MPIGTWIRAKDSDEVVDYDILWGDELGEDTIQSSTWTVPAGVTKDSDEHTTTVTKIWFSGGTAGATYACTNHIVTNGGRELDQTMKLRVRDR